ncbi:zinc finger protein gcs1 [Coniella lustricola]|uniref:Zinc finger protein gcs1 n=1 Tax=Coniella lustricola TaxID=2025994 RepID=A0A2T3A0N3_9PEZI|nr:zinc finger protein gcs1 [Coniella lustricola]
MASKAMWEVDPETRSKLLAIQKESGNSLCCDCNAPSPQWASPKFGIFICLSCAGVHRGLGVHISFVRSISMDAFKPVEIERMRLGGNDNWKKFFDEHEDTQMRGLTWDDATIAERYNGLAGEEWKERLSAKVEGKEYVPSEKKSTGAPSTLHTKGLAGSDGSRAATPLSGTASNSNNRSQSPASGKVKVDDKYFESLGAANASRPDDLPPNQGGKYAGFGNTPAPKQDKELPKFEDLQRDPLAALSKGFGWFSSTVTKTATSVNKDFIQPTTKQLGESDFAAQARTFGGRLAQSAQAGARNAQEGFNKFVEGEGQERVTRRTAVPLDDSKKAFWDNFASAADQRKSQGSSIGTSAMGKGSSGGSGGSGGAVPAANKKGQDEWDDW